MKKIKAMVTILVFTALIVVISLTIIKTHPALADTDKEQKLNLIWQCHQQRNSQSVIKEAEAYLKLYPQEDSGLWIVLAENYMWTDKLDEAEKAVKEALKMDPQSSWGLRTLATIYRSRAEQSPQLKQKYLSEAQLKIEEALTIDPEDAYVQLEAAQIYLSQGEKTRALKAVNEAIRLAPEEDFLGLKNQILSQDK